MGIGLLSPFRYPLTPHPLAASPPCSCLGSFPPLLFFHERIPFSMLRRKHCMTFAISSHLHETLLRIHHCGYHPVLSCSPRMFFQSPRLVRGRCIQKTGASPRKPPVFALSICLRAMEKIMHFARQSAEAIRFPGSHIPHASLPATFSPPHCTNTYRCLPRLPRVHRWKDYPPP